MPEPSSDTNTQLTASVVTRAMKLLLSLFADRLIGISLCLVFAPGCVSLWLLVQHQLANGIALLVVWSFLFIWLARALHRHGLVRLWVSIPSVILVLGCCLLMLLARR